MVVTTCVPASGRSGQAQPDGVALSVSAGDARLDDEPTLRWAPSGRWLAFEGADGRLSRLRLGGAVEPFSVEVPLTPADRAADRDPQLMRAVEIVLEKLAEDPKELPKRPAYPRR